MKNKKTLLSKLKLDKLFGMAGDKTEAVMFDTVTHQSSQNCDFIGNITFNGKSPEIVSNKSTNIITDAISDTKYPSVKAVKSYVDAANNGNSIGTIVTITASGIWTVPAGVALLKDVFIFGGGGAGSYDHGAGGGAGGLRHLINYPVTPGSNIAAIIGAGGTAIAGSIGNAGGDSSFDGLLAYGGGPGLGNVGSDGGCGGGASYQEGSHRGGFGAQGYCGGGFPGSDVYGGGGGGGVGCGGAACLTSGQRADGGYGIDLSAYVGTSIGDSGWFGAGGGGGVYLPADNTRYGRGGKGGGGDGGHNDGTNGRGKDAMPNTGSGGGGSSLPVGTGNGGGSGGSGIIIIRY